MHSTRKSDKFDVELLHNIWSWVVAALLNLKLFQLLKTLLDQINDLKDLTLSFKHSEATRQNFDQIFGSLLLVLCQLVLLVNDVELFLQDELFHLDLQSGSRSRE